MRVLRRENRSAPAREKNFREEFVDTRANLCYNLDRSAATRVAVKRQIKFARASREEARSQEKLFVL
jgi:hypothetical protein